MWCNDGARELSQRRGADTYMRSKTLSLCLFALAAVAPPVASAQPQFPVEAELFNDQFRASEGLTFNACGELFIAADRGVWRVEPTGEAVRITDTYSNLGLAGVGDRDILMADFGPTNVFRDGPNDDGIVWRISPDGEKVAVASGIADPNFVLVAKDRSFLVSDDGTDKIYRVDTDGTVEIWTDLIPYPNGMAYSPDGSIIYVAQIFKQLDPVVFDNAVWALRIGEDGQPAGEPRLVARVGDGGVDGLAMDDQGRIYVADNQGGRIWRVDPSSGESVLITENIPNVASLAFGEGDFDHESIYATTTFRGGGRIWRIAVGAKGARLNR